jgi:Phytanoyl-CoA dioxygenase (PhyH)
MHLRRENLNAYFDDVKNLGFAVVPNVVVDQNIESIIADLARLPTADSSRDGKMYAARNLLSTVLKVGEFAGAPEIRSLVQGILGNAAFPVRGILFDKVPGANWHVAWHQDQIIPVAQRREVAGFTSWSVKKGVPHVRPPISVLERMLALRIHLDECNAENGTLKVIPSSHKLGLLTDNQIEQMVLTSDPIVCEAGRGAVLAMRPLLLHASAPATSPLHRRVVHLEFAIDLLPGGLEWPRWDVNSYSGTSTV